ncbi:energy transducer TonB [Nannocystaceae bacterium ST9]
MVGRVEAIVFGTSVLVHAGLAWGVARVEPRELPPPPPIVITVREVEPEPPPAKPEPPKPEPEVVEPEPELVEPEPEVVEPEPAEPAPPEPAEPSPPEPAPAEPAPAAPPEFGLELGGPEGPGGLAVPKGDPEGKPGGGGGGKKKVVAEKRKLTPEPAQTKADAGCTDKLKAKPLKLAKPTYTEAARAAKLEGAVRLKLQVAADGSVGEVEVVQSLDPELDERAIEAAKASSFEPAQACGKPVASSVTLSIRFSL